jgi:hypothetical protein
LNKILYFWYILKMKSNTTTTPVNIEKNDNIDKKCSKVSGY